MEKSQNPKPIIKCIAFVNENNMISGAFNINLMPRSTFGLLVLEIEHLLNKLKEKYREQDIEVIGNGS